MIGDCRKGARVEADGQFGTNSRWMRTLGIELSRKGSAENRLELEHNCSTIGGKIMYYAFIDFG